MDDTKMTAADQAVYDFLVSKVLAGGQVHQTHQQIAQGTGKSRRTVQSAVDHLYDLGKIVWRGYGRITLAPPEHLRGRDLRGVDLTGINLQGADLRGMNLEGAILREAKLDNADLRHANLNGCDLEGASLRNADVGFAKMKGAQIRRATLDNLITYQTDLADPGTCIENVRALGAIFPRVNLRGAHIRNLWVGTPLQQQHVWGDSLIDDEQVTQIKGYANVHFLLARLLYKTLAPEFGRITAAFISALIESEQFGCWQDGIAYLTTRYPKEYAYFVRAWRSDPQMDPLTLLWIEIEMHIMYFYRLRLRPIRDFWEILKPLAPDRMWRFYIEWQMRLDQGLQAITTRTEIDALGGCREDCFGGRDHSDIRPDGPPDYLQLAEIMLMERTLEEVGLLDLEQIAQQMQGLTHRNIMEQIEVETVAA